MTIASGQIIMASDIIQLQNRIADLEAKLRNVETSSVKKTDVIKHITPNYSKGESKYNGTWVANANGILRVRFVIDNGGRVDNTFVSVNGNKIYGYAAGSKANTDESVIYINKGDTIVASNANLLIFYPYINQ